MSMSDNNQRRSSVSARPLKVAFFGAGGVNFGTPEGPWDHATRLEKYAAQADNTLPIVVSAIIDPFVERVKSVLETRRSNPAYAHMYADTKVYTNMKEMFDAQDAPDAVVIGLPPDQHGTCAEPRNIEVECAKRGIHMLVEKPISCHPLPDVEKVGEAVAKAVEENGLVVSVAYMLRYSAAVEKMKEIIQRVGRPVAGVLGRYCSTYPAVKKQAWWDVRSCGGPIVEQATHFCDLSRYLGGDVVTGSITSMEIGAHEEVGQLSCLPIDESAIDPEHRISRMTSAMWRFKSGAIGNLSHTIALHGTAYVAEIEVWGDGFRLLLQDPYNDPILRVRLPGSDAEISHKFEGDDLYYNEMQAFMNSVRAAVSAQRGDGADGAQELEAVSGIRSTYADALKTYQLSVAIRDAARAMK